MASFRSTVNDGELVRVDATTKDDITEIVRKTWNKRLVGRGNDARHLNNYDQIEILDVEKVKNPFLWSRYVATRQQILRERGECIAIEDLPRSEGPVICTVQMPKRLKGDLYSELNEVYLFHGTTVDRIGGIVSGGYKPSKTGMFGSGIYQAEKSTKADQYADEYTDRSPPGYRLKLILNRTLLGNVKLCAEPRQYRSAPSGYDSVMADGDWLFREFVVYDESQVFPEYVITYKRIPK